MPTDDKVKAEKVLKSTRPPVLEALKAAFGTDRDKPKPYTELLYNQACDRRMSIEDPVAFSNAICDLIAAK